ncbi:MAG: 23S rRNA (guanosine(2251)-2'-O)-methyltransferase RlmB [Clostridia bacterium]
MIIEGKNAVIESLKGDITIEKVMFLKSAPNSNFDSIITLCKEQNIPYNFLDKYALDRISPTGKHQGVLAFGTDFVYSELDDLLVKKDNEYLLLILLDGIEDPHNLGAIVRVADCVGANGIIISKHRCCGVTDTAIKVSSGACSYVKIAKVNNLNDTIRDLKEKGIFVYATDMAGESIYKTNLCGDIAIVIGSEGEGVHTLTQKLSDATISLPQKGKINSLNASVATGVVLYECLRQRSK